MNGKVLSVSHVMLTYAPEPLLRIRCEDRAVGNRNTLHYAATNTKAYMVCPVISYNSLLSLLLCCDLCIPLQQLAVLFTIFLSKESGRNFLTFLSTEMFYQF